MPFRFDLNSEGTSKVTEVSSLYRGKWSYLLALAVLTAHCLLAANPSLTGTVADDTGHPIPGARVLISYAPSINLAVPAPPVIAGPLAAMVTADATGAFHVDTLPPAQYIACAKQRPRDTSIPAIGPPPPPPSP